MSDKLRWRTLLVAVVFFLVSMSGMLVYANEKAIVITEGNMQQIQSTLTDSEGGKKTQFQEARSFVFDVEGSAGERLCIPLKSGVKAENIMIENRYMSKELRITVLGCEVQFYNTQAVYGDISGITAGTYEGNSLGVLMKFELDNIYECRTMLEGNKLYIEFVPAEKLYDKIIVIDSMDAISMDEISIDKISMDIARKVKTKLDASDIKAYFTKLDNSENIATMSAEESAYAALELAEQVNADFIVGIGTSMQAEDETVYGAEAVYNDLFFTTGLNSVTVADYVLREVVTQTSGRGNGLIPATEAETLIWNAEIPTAYLKVGYLTNEKESALLEREDYREKIAEGIYQAILKIYEGETN